MKQVISRSGALKTFYYLMAVDGDVTAEIEKFNEIGRDFLKEEFDSSRQQIIDECDAHIGSAVVDDELYDVIQEGVDKALGETVNKVEDGVCPRLLIWDMLSIAYTDNEYSEPEKRMIAHVARVLDVQKDVVMEMEHLMKTADAVIKELETLNSSNKPYSEIRPIVDEIEKRKQTITKAAEELIADDFVLERPQKEHKDEEQSNVFSEAGKMISDTLNPVADQVGDFAKKTFSDAKDLVDKIDTKEISEGAGKLFSKMKGMIGKNTGFNFPSNYTLVKKDESLDVGAPKSTWVFNKTSANTEAEVFSVKVSKREAMDFDNPQALIDDLHGQVDDFSGLIEVKAGKSKNSSIVLVAESDITGGAIGVAERLKKEHPEYEARITILGHIQRGGSPTAADRILASRLGAAAIDALIDDQRNIMVGVVNDRVVYVPFNKAIKHEKKMDTSLLSVLKVVSN